MTRPYSEDIRERALARADAGETVRSIAEALQISPPRVTKWKDLRRETGGPSPGKIGGHKKPVLSGANADWLRKRIRSGPHLAQVDEGTGGAWDQDRRAGGAGFCSRRRG
jgi:putative transposase